MQYESLGVDQQGTSIWSRQLYPTLFDKTVERLGTAAADAARAGGTYAFGKYTRSDAERFVELYMDGAGKIRSTVLSKPNSIAQYIFDAWGEDKREQMVQYFNQLQRLAKAGRIPEEILKPWTYTPPSPLDPGKALETVGNKILVAGVIGIVAYAVVMSAPRLIHSATRRTRPRPA